MVGGFITHCTEDFGRKGLIFHLCLLETDDLGAILDQPLLDPRKPGLERIHIPRHESKHSGGIYLPSAPHQLTQASGTTIRVDRRG